tara:strand:+ start:510 stop:1268 length:759 start_codon:yes stop_codon:yes gene_type:complete
MNYKKNLILLLSLVNIALVIILLVNKKINIELFSQCAGRCPQTLIDYTSRSEGNTCSQEGDITTSATNVSLFPHYYILYFLINDPATCQNAELVNDIYDSYFTNEDQFYCTHTIKGTTNEFYRFIDCNDIRLCSEAANITSPAIFIRYPYKREFLKLPGNGYFAIEYGKPNTQLSILSVHDYPSAKLFVERVKKSQCESYEVASCGTFRTEAFSFTLIPEAKEEWRQHMSQHDCSTVRQFTSCDDTHECPSN